MKIITAAEMREIDRATSERFGVPMLTLMENAGTAVAEFVVARYPQAERIGVVCGKGNNGGDGLVAARKLHQAGKKVSVLLLADPAELRGDAAANFPSLPLQVLAVRSEEELNGQAARQVLDSEVLIDAILGMGFRPPVGGLLAAGIEALNASRAPVVAVDIPSGADTDVKQASEQASAYTPDRGVPRAQWTLTARADAIVTFTAPKIRHVFDPRLSSGPIVVAGIGSPAEAITSTLKLNVTTPRDLVRLRTPRDPEAHKGDFGHVLVIGGSTGKAGAAAMAGMAALRAGAGLVTVATPKSVLPTVAGFAPEIMTEPLEETEAGTISLRALEYGRMDAILEGKDVVAIGPGISRHPDSAEFVRILLARCPLPVVIDADGLNAFEGNTARLDGRNRAPLVLTPHPGEMARLAGISTREVQADRIEAARHFARQHHVWVVLKGHRSLTVLPDGTVWVNPTGNPGMASGGMGDILTGMAAGLLAQAVNVPSAAGNESAAVESPEPLLEAVIAAVYLHGLAGDVARNLVGEHSLVATDLLAMLPLAFDRVRQRAATKFTLVSD